MALRCPYCQHSLSFKSAKPGRYSPQCPKCAQKFLLTIPAEADQPPVAQPLPAAAGSASGTKGTAGGTTVAAPPPPRPAAAPAVQKAPPPASPAARPVEAATGVWNVHAAETLAAPSAAPAVPRPAAPPPSAPEATGVFQPRGFDPQATAVFDQTVAHTPAAGPASAAQADPNATGAFLPHAQATAVFGQTAAGGGNPHVTAAAGADATQMFGHGANGQGAANPRPTGSITVGGQGGATNPGRSNQQTLAIDAPNPALPDDVPGQLGGYRLVKELGRGGMGSVFLAKQVSLDRNVALKVMQPQWSSDATFVARFTREAYAAAQLTHHNVVQIYDIGQERQRNFFSMEFVEGESLGDLVKREGKLDSEVAVSLVLQAARGLKFAHDQGMIHRDIKPDNLMLNKHGVVKVADMGLVKTPSAVAEEEGRGVDPATRSSLLAQIGSNVTIANVAMGTPAYMSPEQGENAAGVDHRADIYSLGCTLYVLVTGKTPFEGRTAFEVITKHRVEPMLRPELIVKRVPKELGDIIMRMAAKRLEDRYATMDEVIAALEGFLGVKTAASGPFTPKEDEVQLLEASVKEFNAAPAARIRPTLIGAFVGLSALLFFVMAFFSLKLAIGVLAMIGLTGLIYFVASGMNERTYLFSKARELILGAGWTDWLTWFIGGLLLLTALYVLGWLVTWICFGIVATGAALGFHYLFDRKIAAQRQPALERADQLLKSMRLKGVEEDVVRQFVMKYSGDHWEEFFEALFGYEAKLTAREQLRGERGRARARFRGWRDPVINWIDAKQRARKESRELKHLKKVEAQSLQAQGLSAAEVSRRAEANAAALVDGAAQIRQTVADGAPKDLKDPAAKRAKIKAMLEAAQVDDSRARRNRLAPLELLFGARLRFLFGALLVTGCLLWIRGNPEVFDPEEFRAVASQVESAATQGADVGAAAEAADLVKQQLQQRSGKETKPFFFVNSLNVGFAGLFLVVAAFFRGMKISLFAYPAALATTLATGFVPALTLFYTDLPALGIGAGLMVLGFLFGRSR